MAVGDNVACPVASAGSHDKRRIKTRFVDQIIRVQCDHKVKFPFDRPGDLLIKSQQFFSCMMFFRNLRTDPHQDHHGTLDPVQNLLFFHK